MAHVEDVATKMEKGSRILRAIGGVERGWNKDEMRKIYAATQRSLAE